MLKFEQKKPHPGLRNYIRTYWLIEDSGLETPLDLLAPDGYPEMFFVLHESLRMERFSGGKNWTPRHGGGLIGQATAQFSLQPALSSRILFVKFYPWTPQQWFGLPGWELNDLAVELGAISPAGAFRQLNGALASCPDITDMAALLDAFFLKKRQETADHHAFVQFAVRQIFDSGGTIGIDHLARHIHASRRYVEKLFKEKIGLSPKQYAQIIRVKKTSMYLLDPRLQYNIRDIAHRLDYYDQSHLLKDFKAVMEQSPSLYLQRPLRFSRSDLMSYLDQWDYS